MKKILICLNLLIWAAAVCFAQNALWAGNAARGNDDAYPASIRSSGKAAGMSLALPEGTLVQVKNQKNGNITDVTIVSGQGKPGIFLLLNSTAADALDIHAGEVIMVEIQEKSSQSNPFLDYSADPDAFKKSLNEEFLASPEEDPDNAASVDVEEEMNKMGYASPEISEDESVTAETEDSAEMAEETLETEVAEETTLEEAPEKTEADVAKEPEVIVLSEEDAVSESEVEESIAPEEDIVEVATAEASDSGEEILVAEPEPEPEEEIIPEPESEPVEEIIIIPEPEKKGDFEEVIIADSEITFDAELDYREEEDGETEEIEATPFLSDEISVDELAADDESAVEDKSSVEEDLSVEKSTPIEETPVEPEPQEETELPVIDPDRVIYFLTPAELRPPEPAPEEEPALPVWEDSEDVLTIDTDSAEEAEKEVAEPEEEVPEIHFVPQYVEAEELDAYMNETLEAGSRYVQVASFGKDEEGDVYSNMVSLQDAFPYLPIMLLPGAGDSSLRLMVGPVSRDEVGILLYAMKAHGFTDAFLSREQ